MIFLAIYLDNVLPLNGYCKQPWYWPFTFLKKPEEKESITISERNNVLHKVKTGGYAIEDGTSKQVMKVQAQVGLVKAPEHANSITIRDQAALHGDERMDDDVRAERAAVADGVSSDTPIVIANL